jgi:hypothetical protein
MYHNSVLQLSCRFEKIPAAPETKHNQHKKKMVSNRPRTKQCSIKQTHLVESNACNAFNHNSAFSDLQLTTEQS